MKEHQGQENKKEHHGLIASIKSFAGYLSDKRVEIIGSKELELAVKNSLIAQAVVPEFDFVASIDAATGYMTAYIVNNDGRLVKSPRQNYTEALKAVTQRDADPKEWQSIEAKLELEHVISMLSSNKEYVFYADQVKKDGSRTTKKHRYTYADSRRRTLVLARTDVSDVFKERRLREEEEKKRIAYLDRMPVAFCSIEVLLDENKQPYDFMFTYCNSAHEKLEGVKHGELIGKTFYEFFRNTDKQWLNYYYDTAYNGRPNVIRRFSPEIRKELLIYTFCTEPGHCECVLLDVTKEWQLDNELLQSKSEMQLILETTTSLVFRYDAEAEELKIDEPNSLGGSHVVRISEITDRLTREGVFSTEGAYTFRNALRRARNGEHYISEIIKVKLSSDSELCWYRITLVDFNRESDAETNILGYFQNIDREMQDREKLKKQAETDPLTGLLNSGAGKGRIREILKSAARKTSDDGMNASCHAMCILDLDNFKSINDAWGHLIGDNVLRRFARVLKDTFRAEDVVFRLGGDEFAVFMELTGERKETIGKLMARYNKNIEKAREQFPFLSTSVGIFVTDRPHGFEHLYEEADKALYSTKKNGKNSYSLVIEDTACQNTQKTVDTDRA